MTRRRTSRIVSLGVSLTLALGTVAVGSSPAAAGQGEAPDVPGGLRVSELSANSATLEWDATDGAVSYSVILIGPTPSQHQTAEVEDPTVTFHLRQGLTYVADVRAFDADGDFSDRMAPEDRLEFTMPVDPDDAPVTAPGNVRVEVDPETLGVVAEWDPSTSEAGGVFYWVRVEQRGGWTRWFETDQPAITLHLQLGETYDVRVSASDAVGRGSAWSDPVEVTTPETPPPSAPENVHVITSPGSVTVEWDGPTEGAGVKSYSVVLRGAPVGAWTRSTTDTTATFDVPPGGEFEVTVSARDWLERRSDSSEPVRFTLEPAEEWEPPTAPANLRAVSDDSQDGIIFKWDASTGGVAPLTYRIHLNGTEIESTQALRLESPYFTECTSESQHSAEFFVTANSFGFESPPSESITLCFA